jgi:hypothetical protein
MTAPELAAGLRQAHERLISLRADVEQGAPWPLADRFDHSDEAVWGPPELLAHVAEMLPYWQGEVERILGGGPEAVPFGRVGSDANRIGRIERDRTLPPQQLDRRVDEAVERWADRLAALSPADLGRSGLHPTLGHMPVEAIVTRFVVGHLEEHAEQLQAILDERRAR